jgi:hypothetical protein
MVMQDSKCCGLYASGVMIGSNVSKWRIWCGRNLVTHQVDAGSYTPAIVDWTTVALNSWQS